jgi:hypothetical protein
MTADPAPVLRVLPADGGADAAIRWDPRRQFVGALLWHTADSAVPFLAAVPGSAIDEPLTRWAYEVIGALVAVGRDPHPTAVLHRAKSQPATRALHPERPPTGRDHHRLATHLADLYVQVLDPDAVADHARDVLDEAYRCAVRTAGERLCHLADTRPDTAGLVDGVAAVCAALTSSPPPGAA